MRRSWWLGFALALGLWGLSIAVKVPVLEAPPYWDEGLHYWTARHLGQGYTAITDIWDNPIAAPAYLLFQRPLFYVAFWLPAQGGFEAFRVTHAVAASVLSPLAYAVLRAHGARRPVAFVAGAAVAVVPQIAMWGNLGLMDSLMTACIGVMLWARATDRNGVLFLAGVAATWTKETAYAAVLGLLAFEAWRAYVGGRLRLAPLRLDARLTALAYAAAVAPWPLMWAVAHDLQLPGAVNHGSPLPVLDRMFTTPWLLPILAAGLLRARSRFLCGFALAAGGFLLALQMAARDVPQWYEVPTAFFALVGVAAAADAWWRDPTPAWARPGPAVVAIALVALLVLVPNSPERDLLRPLSGDGGNDLEGSWDFETRIRDGHLHAAIAALPLDRHPDVLAIDVPSPALFVPIVEQANRTYFDSSVIRALAAFDVPGLAARIEHPTTWTIVDRSDLPMARAVELVYADCVTHENPGFLVLQGTPCAGRADELEAQWRELDPRF